MKHFKWITYEIKYDRHHYPELAYPIKNFRLGMLDGKIFWIQATHSRMLNVIGRDRMVGLLVPCVDK